MRFGLDTRKITKRSRSRWIRGFWLEFESSRFLFNRRILRESGGMRTVFVAALFCSFSLACGGAKNPPPANATGTGDADAGAASTVGAAGSGSAASSGDAGTTAVASNAAVDAGAPAAPPDAHPFAKDAADAESMIDDAIESRHAGVEKCAAEARKRTGDPHGKVSLLVGIDQEGTVIGVKGHEIDPAAPDRVRALAAARRSVTAIVVDGGIRKHTVPMLAGAGADGVVPGSLVFAEPHPRRAVAEIRALQTGRGEPLSPFWTASAVSR